MPTKTPAKQWLTKVMTVIAALGVIIVAGTVFAYPAVAAVACPTCYGLERLNGDAFVCGNSVA